MDQLKQEVATVKKIFRLSLSVLALALTTDGWAASGDGSCEEIWLRIERNTALSQPLDKAKAMENLGSACLGDVAFQVRRVNYYLKARELDRAEGIIAASMVEKPNSPELQERLAEVVYLKGDLNKAEAIASKLIQSAPTFAAPYLTLSSIAAQKRDWQSTERYQRKAFELTHTPLLLLPLVSALHQLDRHKEAVETAYRALREDPNLISRSGGIDEAIYSLAALGRFDEAKRLIHRRMAADPSWAQDATLVQAARRLAIID